MSIFTRIGAMKDYVQSLAINNVDYNILKLQGRGPFASHDGIFLHYRKSWIEASQ